MSGSVDLTVSNTTKPEAGLPGGIATTGPVKIISRLAGGAIPFGYAVKRTATGVDPVAAAGDNYEGIAIRDSARKTDATTFGYVANDMVAVMREGDIFGYVYENVVKDAQVYVRCADGALGSTFTSGTTKIMAGCFFDEAGTAAGVARVRMNLTN